jgi:hypothetical protein
MDDIKHRLRTEIASHWAPHRLGSVRCILVIDLDRPTTTARGGRVRHELCAAARLQASEPEDRLLHCLADGQEAVVLQQSGLLVAKGSCDVLAFGFGQDDPIELLVDNVVLWEERKDGDVSRE